MHVSANLGVGVCLSYYMRPRSLTVRKAYSGLPAQVTTTRKFVKQKTLFGLALGTPHHYLKTHCTRHHHFENTAGYANMAAILQ